MTDTGKVDTTNPAANMYGCVPCPKCGGGDRYSIFDSQSKPIVQCDACGFHEPTDKSNPPNGEQKMSIPKSGEKRWSEYSRRTWPAEGL